MSPEAVDYMSTAERALHRAELMFAAEIYDAAARDAYLSALSAARAVNFERSGRATKSHSGTRTEFLKLVHSGMAFDSELARFLARGFELKQDVDYGPIRLVTRDEAEDFLRKARAFLAAAKAVCA